VIDLAPFQPLPFKVVARHSFMLCLAIVLALLAVRSLAGLNMAYITYYDNFIEPSYIVGKNWSRTTVVAQQSIIRWADWLSVQEPWCTHISPPHL
jgi:hypothetical protein